MRVFVDSFFLIAVLDASDAYHRAALDYQRGHRLTMTTTRWVLAEVADALSSPALREKVGEFISEFPHQPGVTVKGQSDGLFASGLARYRARLDKHWSLTDCISFVVMEQEGLREVLTGDRHFGQAGFVALFAD